MSVNQKNVLILFSSSEIGGAERSIGNMAVENSNQSINYQIATFGSIGPLTHWVKNNSKKCYYFQYKVIPLMKHINSYKPDIIYVIGFIILCTFFT